MVLMSAILASRWSATDKLDPPNRVSSYEWVNLPIRWDAGWYLGIAVNGYNYDPNARPTTQQNIAFFPAYPMAMRAVTAWLGGRIIRPDERMSGNRIEWQYALHRRALAAGLLVSIGAFGWGLVYLYRLVACWRRRDRGGVGGGPGLRVAVRALLQLSIQRACSSSASWARGTTSASASGRPPSRGVSSRVCRPNGFLVSVPLSASLTGAPSGAETRGAPDHAARRRGVGRAWRRRPHLQAPTSTAQRASAGPDGGAPGVGPGATDVAGLFTERADVIANQGLRLLIGQPISW